jgi:hypothetical protein
MRRQRALFGPRAGQRRRTTVLAAALVAALLVAGCGVQPQSEPKPVPSNRLPSVETTEGAPAPGSRARVWGVRDQRIVPVFVELTGPGVVARVTALLTLRRSGQQPLTSIPDDTRLLDVERQGDNVVLSLSRELLRTPERDVPLALGQLVLTATEQPGVRGVEVQAGDAPVRLVSGEGVTLSRPLSRDDFWSLLESSARD